MCACDVCELHKEATKAFCTPREDCDEHENACRGRATRGVARKVIYKDKREERRGKEGMKRDLQGEEGDEGEVGEEEDGEGAGGFKVEEGGGRVEAFL